MIETVDIKRMSKAEKLKTMEALWEDLTSTENDLESPVWHQEELRATENRVEKGQEKIADWESAKAELRSRFE